MNKNVGTADRIMRIAAAIVVFALIGMESLQGTLAWVLGGLSLVFVATSLVSWCPIYAIFGMSSLRKKV